MPRKRKSIRLKNYDYGQQGAYDVTVCTRDQKEVFGDIINDEMVLNETGKIVEFTWMDLTQHNDNIELDEFIIMPNHIHGIIIIAGAGSKPALKDKGAGLEPAPTQHGLPEIVRQFKTFSARRINQINKTQDRHLWQRNYYEHIIRDQRDLERIREYIRNNPAKWAYDEENINRKL